MLIYLIFFFMHTSFAMRAQQSPMRIIIPQRKYVAGEGPLIPVVRRSSHDAIKSQTPPKAAIYPCKSALQQCEEAEKILLNDPRISQVDIRLRPFFIDRVSNILNNIIFEVKN